MNTSRAVKRATQQMIKQSGIDGDGGEAVFPEKLKRERMRKLSVVGRVISSNEDGGGSGIEDELRSITRISKRFKLPRKFFYDRKTVDHASVPRKLRSAMKKRNQGSISPPLSVKKPRKDGIKKSTWNEQQGDLEDSPSWSMVGPITKDEEEVVQTLYALAEMFPNSNGKNGSDGEFAKAKSWSLPEGESSRPASEAREKEENSKSLCPANTVEAVNPSVLEGSALLTVDAKHSNEQSVPNSIHLHTELDDAISKRNFQAMPLCSHCKPINGKTSCRSVGCNVQSEMSPGNGSKRPKHEEAAACERKPEMEAAAVSSLHQSQYILTESKKSGSTLWPGLSSAESHGAGAQGPSLQSSSTMIPAQLGMAAAAAPLGNVALTEKDSRDPVARMKSSKRSSAHVYICRLIKALQFAEKTDRSSAPPAQLTRNEGSKQRVLFTANNVNGDRNGLNGAVSYHNIVGSASERTPNEVRNGIPLHKRLLHDQQQASTSSALYTSLKQDFDFMSLSAVSGGVESSNGTDKAGNELEPLTQFHIPYPQSHAQNHTLMPFSLPENCFSSTPFTYRLPVAAAKQVHIQPPAHLGSPLSVPPHLGTPSTPKQQQQQQQRWIWTALPGQYKPQIPNWQNGKQVSSSSATQYAQSIPLPSYSSLEVLGPRYVPISQQQQELIRRQQHHHLPSGYEGNGVGSYPDTARPLQLLCNEHL